MNQARRPIYFILFVTILLLLSGCSLFAKPEETVETELSAVKKLDGETIAKYISYENLFGDDTTEEITSSTKDVFDLILSHFDYEIQEVSKKGKTASVQVEITTLDMETAVKDYRKLTIENTLLNDIEEDNKMTLDQLFSILKVTLEQDYDKASTIVKLDLEKEKGEWFMKADEELSDALTGHIAELMADPYLLTPEETVTITLDAIKSLDQETFRKFLTPNNILSEDGSTENILCKKVSETFDFKVSSAETKGSVSTVSVEITNINLAAIVPRYEELLLEFIDSYNGVMPSAEETEKAADTRFAQALEEASETNVFPVDISLTNNGTIWVLDTNEEFVNIMLGGLTELEAGLSAMNE